MFDVVGRLLNSCTSHLVRRGTAKTKEDTSCDREYNTEDMRHDEQPLPLSVGMKNEMNGMKEDMDGMDKSMKGVETVVIEKKKEEMKDLSNNDENEPRTAIELRIPNANARSVDEDDEDETASAESFYDYCYSYCFPIEDEGWTTTAIEPGIPKKYGSHIEWNYKSDEIIRRMQKERMSKDGNIPSMWNYDPRCLAKEFIGLDQESFLVDLSNFNICFFDKDILRKISKMLDPIEFLNLSYTCRFLHWRLFTFCTCYAPYIVCMEIHDHTIGEDEVAEIRRYKEDPNMTVYTRRLKENDRQSMPDLIKLEDLQVIFAYIPPCLRRPFFFDQLKIEIYSPFFTKDDFDRYLPFILPVRKYARQLDITLTYSYPIFAENFSPCDDYPAVNDFLQTINTSSYFCHSFDFFRYYERTFKVFENCPYARVMDTLHDIHFDNSSKWENLVLLNRIGHYINPPVSTIIRTIEEFKYGIANLDYHEYEFNYREKRIAFLEYLFANYDKVEEYSRKNRKRYEQEECALNIVRFVTITTKETGRRHRIKMWIDCHWTYYIAIGKESTFSKNLKKRRIDNEDFEDLKDCKASSKWYRMETALEPDE